MTDIKNKQKKNYVRFDNAWRFLIVLWSVFYLQKSVRQLLHFYPTWLNWTDQAELPIFIILTIVSIINLIWWLASRITKKQLPYKTPLNFINYLLFLVLCGWSISTHIGDWYSDWLAATPSAQKKVTKAPVKIDNNAGINPPNSLQALNLMSADLSGYIQLGALASQDGHIKTAIYAGMTTDILNTGNAGTMNNANLGEKNNILGAHTYSFYGETFYKGFTAMQYETKVGDLFYLTNGQKVWTYKVFKRTGETAETLIAAQNGGWIADENLYQKDQKNPDYQAFEPGQTVNPSGKPMLTLFDCYEPAGSFIEDPPYRNVVWASQEKAENYATASNDIKGLFQTISVDGGQIKDGQVHQAKAKDVTPRNFPLNFYDFLFKDMKIQQYVQKK